MSENAGPSSTRLSPSTSNPSLQSQITTYCWKLANFKSKWLDACNANQNTIASGTFPLMSRPEICVELHFKSLDKDFSKIWFGVWVEEFGENESFKLDLKIWMKSERNEEFCVQKGFDHMFNEGNKNFGWGGMCEEGTNLLKSAYENHETLFICAEITDLGVHVENEFSQNVWNLFKEQKHDSIVKVDSQDFKIFKSFSIAQSKAFEGLFLSAPKKDDIQTIEIKDASTETVEQLIKWLYTGQFDRGISIEELYKTAKNYEIELLKEECVGRLISSLDKKNAFERLILAVENDEDKLKRLALDEFVKISKSEAIKILMDSEWLRYAQKNIKVFNEVGKLVNEKISKGENGKD